MACNDVNQSAISEVRDQLMLDTADGNRLNIVTGNLGLDRPLLTMGDDEWRAAAKSTALQAKLIKYAYVKMIEICVGPQFARIGTLALPTTFDDKELTVLNGAPYVQVGTLRIDPLLATEETVKYCIRDATTGVFELSTALTQPHVIIPPGSDRLRAAASSGATSLLLANSSILPTAGFPYPVMVDQGTVTEEIVLVSANNTGSNTLTVSATTYAHAGPTSGFVVRQLAFAAPKGRTFVRLASNATRVFPAAGFLRINDGGGADEVVEYVENDVTDSVLMLKTPLQHAHAAAQMVELVTAGAPVSVAQVVEAGIHWTISIPSPRHVLVTIPKNLTPLGPLDATWFHDAVPAPFSTTLAANALTTDQYLLLTSVTGVQREAGMVQINAFQVAEYDLVLAQEDIATVTSSTLAGVTSMAYTLAGTDDFAPLLSPFAVTINPGGGHEETVAVIAAATDVGRLVFSAPLAHPHTAGEVIRIRNQILLPDPIGTPYTAGQTVALYQTNYGGTDLDDGNIRGAGPSYTMRLRHFAGGYVYDQDQRGISDVFSTLSSVVAPPTAVAAAQMAGRTNLEVKDASLWPAPPFTPFSARIGAGAGYQEDQVVVDRTLRTDAAGTCSASTSAGATVLPYTLTTTGDFPESDGVNAAGYRVLLNRGGPRQEIVLIDQNDIGVPEFSLINPTVHVHNIGDTAELLNDVLTFGPLIGPHAGPVINPSALGELVQPLITLIPMAALPAGFPTTGGFAWINFGKEIIDQRQRIASITDATHYVLRSTALFPTTNYPYEVILAEGTHSEERVFVTNNNTGTNTLTFAAPGALNTHAVAQYVQYRSGDPEVVEFSSTETSPNALVVDPPVTLDGGHLVGERVMFSPGISQSNLDGSSFGFKLPPDPTACVTALLELVRTAGVLVNVVQR